jgi:hypothetical protein
MQSVATTPTAAAGAAGAPAPVQRPEPVRPTYFRTDPPPMERVRYLANLSRQHSLKQRHWNPRARVHRDRGKWALTHFIRHSLTTYDELRQGLNPLETDTLKSNVNRVIFETYPELKGAA